MRILIPVDGSTCSRAAVRFIGARSKFMGEKPDVTLLNVQQNIPGTVIEHFSLEAVRSVYEAEGKAIVEKLAPEIEAYGIEPHMAASRSVASTGVTAFSQASSFWSESHY